MHAAAYTQSMHAAYTARGQKFCWQGGASDLLMPFVMQKGKAADCSGRPEDLPKRSMFPLLWAAADSQQLLQSW